VRAEPEPISEDEPPPVLEEIDPGSWLKPSRRSGLVWEPEIIAAAAAEPEALPVKDEEVLAFPSEGPKEAAPVAMAPAPLLVEMLPLAPTDGLLSTFPDEPSSDERSDLPTIGSIREGLPRTMERLLQIPTAEEVAQNSYKSPFRETREELIRRLFDPPLTLEDTARLLGVCPTTVRRYTNKGLLQHYRTQGNQRRFRLSDLLAFLERWGDAGPEAGALGGSASTRRLATGGSRVPRKTTGTTGGSKDEEKSERPAADADAGGTDGDRV